ncbi:MAG: hypothetical protein PHV61_07290 [Limnochordia bacterium]|nr:hypothetical protein [Limnochordia bacterium]
MRTHAVLVDSFPVTLNVERSTAILVRTNGENVWILEFEGSIIRFAGHRKARTKVSSQKSTRRYTSTASYCTLREGTGVNHDFIVDAH